MDYAFEQGRAAQAQADERNLRIALRAMKRLGATEARAEYDGCGDEGQVEELEIVGAECGAARVSCWEVVSEREGEGEAERLVYRLRRTSKTLREVVEAAMYRHLEERHGGWENGEGAFGALVLEVASGELRIEHNDRYIAYDESVTHFPVGPRAARQAGA
jgi:hypothetical protein